jgi:hypothetical protein
MRRLVKISNHIGYAEIENDDPFTQIFSGNVNMFILEMEVVESADHEEGTVTNFVFTRSQFEYMDEE